MVNNTSRPVDCNNLASYAFRSNSCWDVQFVVSKAAALLVRDQKGEQIALLGVIGENGCTAQGFTQGGGNMDIILFDRIETLFLIARYPYVDPNQAVIRAGEWKDTHQTEEWIAHQRPENTGVNNAQVLAGQHIIGAQVARCGV
jgi:hypothetical protein